MRALSRRPRPVGWPVEIEWAVGDLGTGAGIGAAVTDVDTIIHCASDYRRARKDLPGVRRFLDAARDAGVAHLVYISIVGIDRVPLSYYRVKLDEERLIESSALAWTILRTTQFHDLVHRIAAALARLPVMVIPSVPDLGGPQIHTFRELALSYLRASGKRRLLVPLRLPGAAFRGYRQGGHLAPEHAAGRRTFEEYLTTR